MIGDDIFLTVSGIYLGKLMSVSKTQITDFIRSSLYALRNA